MSYKNERKRYTNDWMGLKWNALSVKDVEPPKNYGIVTFSDTQGIHCETICGDCYNKEMEEVLAVEDFKNFEPNIILKDCEGIESQFEIIKMIHATGVFWEAVEFLVNDNIGYSFEVYQGFEYDSIDALRRLTTKVNEGLSKKYIKKTIFRGEDLLSFSSEIVEGKIEWDDNYVDRIPKFKIDGKDYSAEQIGKILMGYEG